MSTYVVGYRYGVDADRHIYEEEFIRIRAENILAAQYIVNETIKTTGVVRVTIEHTGLMPNGIPRPTRTVWEKD